MTDSCVQSSIIIAFEQFDNIEATFDSIKQFLCKDAFEPIEFAKLYILFFRSCLQSYRVPQLQCLYSYMNGKVKDLQQMFPYERLIGNIGNLINQQILKPITIQQKADILLEKEKSQFKPRDQGILSSIERNLENFFTKSTQEEQNIASKFNELLPPYNAKVLVIGNTTILEKIINNFPEDTQIFLCESSPDNYGQALFQKVQGTLKKLYLVADTAIAGLMDQFQVVIANCRYIYKSGSCQLDSGSLSVLEVAKYYKKMVFVPVQSVQVCRDNEISDFFQFKEKNVVPGGDFCPATLINYYVLNDGVYSPQSVFKYVDNVL